MDSIVDIPLRDGEIDLILARKYFSNGYAICVFGLLVRGRERMTTKMTTIEGCIDNRKKR